VSFGDFLSLAAMRLIAEVMVFERFGSAPSFMKFTDSSLRSIRRGIAFAGEDHEGG
jgi:hypothetical protein